MSLFAENATTGKKCRLSLSGTLRIPEYGAVVGLSKRVDNESVNS